MIVRRFVINIFLFFISQNTIFCAERPKTPVLERPCPDSIIVTFSYIGNLRDALNLAATDRYFHNTFYNAIITNSTFFRDSVLFVQDNYRLCTQMLISCAKMYGDAVKEKKKIEKRKYSARFHSLWRYSSPKRDEQIRSTMGDQSYERNPALAKQIKISLYAGTAANEKTLKNALCVYMRAQGHDILQVLIKHNIRMISTFKKCGGYKGNFINTIYSTLGMSFIKKIIDSGIDLEAYSWDKIPLDQRLVCDAYHRNDIEMITFLLDKGVRNTIDFEYNHRDDVILNIFTNRKPIKYLRIAKLLLRRDYFDQKTKNQLLEENAVEYKDSYMAKFDLLLEYGAEKSALSIKSLCLKGYLDELKSLVQKNPNIFRECSKRERSSCLMSALASDGLEILEFLCTQQDIDLNDGIFHDSATVLYYALSEKRFYAAKMLLQYGANINDEKIIKKYTGAYEEWDKETVDFLFKNGFKATAKMRRFANNISFYAFIGGFGFIALSLFGIGLVFVCIGLEGAAKEIWKTIA